MPVNLRHLRAFDAAVRLGSFVEAARALHVSPAALGLAIRELEDTLGFRVLERTTRRLQLTEAGRGYLALAQRVLADLEQADRYARDVQSGHALVRIATTQTIVATLLAPVLHDVMSAFPGVRLHPLDVAASDIRDALVQGRADLAIGVDLPGDSEFEAAPLFTSRWFGYIAPAHPLGRRRRLDWSETAGHLLFMTRSSQLKLRAVLGRNVPLDDVQEATTAISGLAMASAGAGIALFPGYAQGIASGMGVRAVPMQSPEVTHDLLIGVPRKTSIRAPVSAIRDALARAVGTACRHLA
jgi:DNA-binding transcriptional LysR family regulator